MREGKHGKTEMEAENKELGSFSQLVVGVTHKFVQKVGGV